ncbi:hypothetical protein FDI69_gp019 [Rhodococcus phage Trina]|uniref:Uncharacterized protein n=1 Tax=Rhodococcus phage Trina TaxID=2027905 RepID=A0A2D1ADP8_9CAUD|nr:hypothetical protein FDI69_gp019 [Rhodococcus phage Trina]ASZ74837.1 hypothetical protein SEA_TRINA_19 [Rhodococcus phage Trina]
MNDMFGNKVQIGDIGYWVAGMGSPAFYLCRVIKHQKRTQVQLLDRDRLKEDKFWMETEKRFILISEQVTKDLLNTYAINS